MFHNGYIGAMHLRKYLADKDLTAAEFAERIGVQPLAVRRYLNGDRRPAWDVLKRIKDETGGAVSASDFLNEVDLAKPGNSPATA